MRVHKYRAWDKIGKCMYEVTALVWSAASASKFSRIELLSLDATYTYVATGDECDNYEIIECTGINDKNGKEIYESDIMGRKIVEQWDIFEIQGTVRWDSSLASFDIMQNDKTRVYILSNEWEVLGNIYEHPQSLEVS
jgi:uncharacterized phage protein (TIGR01671 family)